MITILANPIEQSISLPYYYQSTTEKQFTGQLQPASLKFLSSLLNMNKFRDALRIEKYYVNGNEDFPL